MPNDYAPFLQAVAGSSIATAVIQSFFQRKTEQDKTKFSWLHKEKTDALKELHAKVVELNNIREKYLEHSMELETGHEINNDVVQMYSNEKLAELQELFDVDEILLGSKTEDFNLFVERSQFFFNHDLNEILNQCKNDYRLTVINTSRNVSAQLYPSSDEEGEAHFDEEGMTLLYNQNEQIIELIGKQLRKEYGTNENLYQSIFRNIRKKLKWLNLSKSQ